MSDCPTFRILIVCTANICRSVMAERLLRREAEARGLPVEVSSCGILFDGEPASNTVIAVMRERQLDVSDHVSRRFTPEMLGGIDLVVTMERMHGREVAVMAGAGSAQIHTLGSVVAWLAQPPESDAGGSSPRARIAEFASGRRASDLLGFGADEVVDPHGRSKRVHRRTADRLEAMCVALLDGLFGPMDTAPATQAEGDGDTQAESDEATRAESDEATQA